MLDSCFAQPLSKSSLIYLLVWSPLLHTAYISSPNHCLPFATHAHTILTCFAVMRRLSAVHLSLCFHSIFRTDLPLKLNFYVWVGHDHSLQGIEGYRSWSWIRLMQLVWPRSRAGFSILLRCHTSIWPFSSLLTEIPHRFLLLQARSHFHVTFYFTHNCCTAFLS